VAGSLKTTCVLLCAVALFGPGRGPWQADPSCDRAAKAGVPAGSITAVERVEGTPSFCRVAATLTPARDSEIRIEVWLPAAGWNGKLQAVGNGAFSGAIATGAMRAALQRGYAAASLPRSNDGWSRAMRRTRSSRRMRSTA
jgi:hypothetical protein